MGGHARGAEGAVYNNTSYSKSIDLREAIYALLYTFLRSVDQFCHILERDCDESFRGFFAGGGCAW